MRRFAVAHTQLKDLDFFKRPVNLTAAGKVENLYLNVTTKNRFLYKKWQSIVSMDFRMVILFNDQLALFQDRHPNVIYL